jgi:hypothetical protein
LEGRKEERKKGMEEGREEREINITFSNLHKIKQKISKIKRVFGGN